MRNRWPVFLAQLFVLILFSIFASPIWAQYNYTIEDGLSGSTIEDGVNLDFWEPWIGPPGNAGASETGYATISNEGLRLGSFNASLGAVNSVPGKWVLTGDFRVTFYLEISPDPGGYGNRLGVYIYESAPVCGALIYPEGYGGLWIGSSPPQSSNYYPLEYGEAAYYLFVKSGNSLSIYKGDNNGVTESESSRVFFGDYFNPDGQFLFGAGTGNPNTGWMQMRDVVIQTEGLVSCDESTQIPPEWGGTNRSFWLIGVGTVEGKTIRVDEMYYTTGGAFGSAFNPDHITNVLWGSLEIEFLTCDSGQVFWETDVAGFEGGDYPLMRLANDPYREDCVATGFDQVGNSLWMSGLWFGGPPRNGEGFSVNIINGNLAVITWYTYLPAGSN